MNTLRTWAVCALLALASATCQAACLLCSCAVSVGDAQATYPANSPQHVDVSVNASVSCEGVLTLGTTYTLAVATGGSGNYAPRRVAHSSGQTLNYNIYNPSYTQVIGDGSGSTVTISDSITLVVLTALSTGSKTHSLNIRIPASQVPIAVGNFTDQLTVTLHYEFWCLNLGNPVLCL